MVEYKIQTFVQLRQGKVTIPATVRKFLKIQDKEYLRLIAESNKIELTPLGTTVLRD